MKRKILILSLLFNGFFIVVSVYFIYKNPSRFTGFLSRDKPLKSGFGPYFDQRLGLFQVLHHDTSDILFVGHSIIDGCEWAELLQDSSVKNRGINGEIIEGLFEQIEILSEPSPKKMFLMMGTNDIGRYDNAEGISTKLEQFIQLYKARNPRTEIYLLGLLPVNRMMDKTTSGNAAAYEKALVKIAEREHCYYVELASMFRDKEGYFDKSYTNDGWHLTGKGYLKMKDVLQPLLR